MQEKCVFTIATGPRPYFDMALNLARSFEHFNHSVGTKFFLFTDSDFELPKDLKSTTIMRLSGTELPIGFSIKLLIDQLAPTDKALFIDADCFITGPIAPLFDVFNGYPVGVFGVIKTDGERFGDVRRIMAALNAPYVPLFNGGIYYIDKALGAADVFENARVLEKKYDEIGFVRLRGQPNEEMLVGAALALRNIMPVPNQGAYYADLQWWPDLIKFDILTGICRLRNPPLPDSRHQTYYPAAEAQPLVIHFLGHYVESPEYRRAALALKLAAGGYFLPRVGSVLGTFHLYCKRTFKDVFRRPFRALFGTRSVAPTKSRLVIDD